MCVCVFVCVKAYTYLGYKFNIKDELKQEVHDINKAVCARAARSIDAQATFSRLTRLKGIAQQLFLRV